MKNFNIKFTIFSIFTLLHPHFAQAQMLNGQDTIYGNEWIDYSNTYFKIKIAEDGIYRIPMSVLTTAGLPGGTTGNGLRLFCRGKAIALYPSQTGVLGNQDYAEFYGEKNRGQLDAHLFEYPDKDQVNTRYSIFNDTSVYYLTTSTNANALLYEQKANNLTNLPPKAPWCWSEVAKVFDRAHVQREVLSYVNYSTFVGNGFAEYSGAQTIATLNLPDIYTSGPNAQVLMRYASPSLGAHAQKIYFNDTLYAESDHVGWKTIQQDFPIKAPKLKSSTEVKVVSVLGGADYHHLAFASIRYARGFNFDNNEGVVFFQLNPSDTKQYLEITGFKTNGGTTILYDLTNFTRTEGLIENGVLKIALSPSAALRQLVLVSNNNGVKTLSTRPAKVRFSDLRAVSTDYLIVSKRSLHRNALQSGADEVAAYADYRRSDPGGRHKVLTVDIDDIYDQFGYGVQFHPIALRNFLQYYKKQVPTLKNVLILGKGLDYQAFRTPTQQKSLVDSIYYVPTYGSPGSDWPFAMKSNGISDPLFAVGRIPVSRPIEIRYYLDKVKAQEEQIVGAGQSIAERGWMRRILHNSGGATGSSENNIIRGYTTDMANILTNSRFGADVVSYYKTSNDPIQVAAFDKMLEQVNGGVSLWTIFGHSSAYFVDFEIGLVENYNNKNRYPMMMVLGCYAGSCSGNLKGLGEQFLLSPNRGAIAYTGTTSAGYINDLHQYSRNFYDLLGNRAYGLSIGELMRQNIIEERKGASPGMLAVLHQGLLQGDPAIHLNPHPGPDYLIDNQSVQASPSPANLGTGTVKIAFDLINIGQHLGGKVSVRIEQRLPDGKVFLRLTDTVEVAPYRKKLAYDVPTQGSIAGFNRFFITVDPDNKVVELPSAAEQNNELIAASGEKGIELYFYADDIQPIFPPNYGIVPTQEVTLSASTANINAQEQIYLWEMDTLETFSSGFLRSHKIKTRGGLVQWKPDAKLQPNRVYYWRIARDSLIDGQLLWRTRSFIQLEGVTGGWNQSHFGQYKDGEMANLIVNEAARRIDFTENAGYYSCQLAYFGVERFPTIQNSFYEGIVGDWGFGIRGAGQGVALVVVDPKTGRLVTNPANGPYSHYPEDLTLFYFNTADSLKRIKLMEFIEKGIPDGYYAAFMTLNNYNDPTGFAPLKWANDSVSYGKNIFSVLEAQGAKQVREVTQFTTIPRPYALLFQKGNPGFAKDTLINSPEEAVLLKTAIPGRWTEGFFETPAFGPVKAWKTLLWNHETHDAASDLSTVNLIGVRTPLPDTILRRLHDKTELDISNIPANIFPKLKLRYEGRDTAARTMTPAAFLRVIYDPMPEGALHPVALSTFYKDTLQQGEAIQQEIAFVNVSNTKMDSLTVKYRMETLAGTGTEQLKKFGPLAPGETAKLRFEASSIRMTGANRLIVDVNPDNAQPELYHFNNVLLQPFFVARDQRNPLLDVTFDGTHILNGDLISPKPEIIATLKDDNRFLAITDTSTFRVTLEKPDGSRVTLPFTDPNLLFFPADTTDVSKKNCARLEWRPTFTEDGDYRLLVNGRDASGNKSAALDFAVSFKIITKSSISNLLNYPNPFSTNTCFIYTMTGAETPAHFKIQIMTISGRIIREITEQEFGILRTGVHRSDYCWDGRDEFGDQLANGVYLYRVVAKKADGSDFEFYDNTAIDGLFKHGFGKMVLMR